MNKLKIFKKIKHNKSNNSKNHPHIKNHLNKLLAMPKIDFKYFQKIGKGPSMKNHIMDQFAVKQYCPKIFG